MSLDTRKLRYWLAVGIAVGTVLVGAFPAGSQGRTVRLPGLDGGELTAEALESGKWIVVVWASWSPRCRDIVERINAIEERWGSEARVVSVSFQEEGQAIEEFLDGKKLSVPVFLDSRGHFSRHYAVTTLPGLLIYQDGEVAYSGKLPNDADALIGRTVG